MKKIQAFILFLKQHDFQMKMIAGCVLILIVLQFIIYNFHLSNHDVIAASKNTQNLQEILYEINQLNSEINNTENINRFAKGDNPFFVAELAQSTTLYYLHLNKLSNLFKDDIQESKILKTLNNLITDRIEMYYLLNVNNRNNKFSTPSNEALLLASHLNYDKIEQLIIPLKKKQNEKLSKQFVVNEKQENFATQLEYYSAGLIVLILIMLFWAIQQTFHMLKNAEENLVRKKTFLNAVFDHMPDTVFVKNVNDLRYIRMNLAGEKILGKDKADIIGKTDFEIFNPKQAAYFNEMDKEALAAGKLIEVPIQKLVTSQGEYYMRTKKIPINDDKGNQRYLLGISEDITAQQLNEQRLNKSIQELANYKMALDESSIVEITNLQGKIIYVNDNFCKISGYEREEIIGQTHRVVNSKYHSKEFFNSMWKTISKGDIWRGEVKNKAKNGIYFWMDSTIVPLMDEKGDPHQYISIRNDITQRKEAEQQIIEANKELEAFTHSVSHDLRSPLRSITGFSKILLECESDNLSAETLTYLKIIHESGNKMDHLINELLEFAHLSKKELKKSKLNMKEIVNIVTSEQINKQKAEDIVIEIKSLLPVYGDELMIKQVVTNLVENAVKYTSKKDKPIIEIGSYRENGSVVYYIKDNGVGFDMQYYKKLFLVFQRLHSSKDFEGTGVGLSIVQRIVYKHGGHIWAEGKVNEGATFNFSLPHYSNK